MPFNQQMMIDAAESHRMDAVIALEKHLGKYSEVPPRFNVKIQEEFDVVSPRRPGLVSEGNIHFFLDSIEYAGKYEIHAPMHSGADDFHYVTVVERFYQ